jgi:hypothetical protein
MDGLDNPFDATGLCHALVGSNDWEGTHEHSPTFLGDNLKPAFPVFRVLAGSKMLRICFGQAVNLLSEILKAVSTYSDASSPASWIFWTMSESSF